MPKFTAPSEIRPWPALWSLVLGFFMILVDTTVVSVANPIIMQSFGTSITAVLWATSAYLLAYAVPLLVTGRLGDRFGPRRIYLAGLALFVVASAACGLSPTIEVLIAARVFQGLGAAMMTPQTMAVITRIFPPRERGQALAIWGVTAGVALLVGPILGGVLIDLVGWEWIFFVNLPVGVIGFVLVLKFVPCLETSRHSFDWLGVVLSSLGMFLLVFGIQEGSSFEWGQIWGPISIWMIIGLGVVLLALFIWWQRAQRGEPLLPLGIFSDRNFSVGSATIFTVGLAVTSMNLPLMFYYQLVLGLSPTVSALTLVPMAVLSAVLARPVGKVVDRYDTRRLATFALLLHMAGLVFFALIMKPDMSVWWMLLPSAVVGLANAFMWGPLSAITMFSLRLDFAGAGSGVYNTSRQIGSVFGSAAVTALMASLLAARFGAAVESSVGTTTGQLPESLRAGFAEAMAQSLMLPAAIILIGAILTLWFAPRPQRTGRVREPANS